MDYVMALFRHSTALFHEHHEKLKSGQPESDPDSKWVPPEHKSDTLPMAHTCSVLRTHRKHVNIQCKNMHLCVVLRSQWCRVMIIKLSQLNIMQDTI
jgi:hypothetical protein